MELITKANDIQFKKPICPPKKKKMKVLDEETYVHELGKIIEKDFFPDLENLKDKVDYLRARENNDIEQLQYFHRKYSTACGNKRRKEVLRNVTDSPATFDTPERITDSDSVTPSGESNLPENKDDVESTEHGEMQSLDRFLATHTSEDDDSFQQILQDSEQKFRLKKAWMFNAETEHNAKYAPVLDMPSLPDSNSEALKAIKDKPTVQENWKFKTFNTIMYVPEDHHPSGELSKPREILHANTRFTGNPFVTPLNQATVMEATAVQAIKKEGRIGVDGRELVKESPRVRGYSFMGEASPAPGVEESPLITWGEVEGTPFMLDKGSTPLVHSSAPSYFIPKVPERDLLALQLNERASESQRTKKTRAASVARVNLCTPGSTGRWATDRLADMSPAARRLLSSSGIGIRQGTDRSLRASYTPGPTPTRVTTPGLCDPLGRFTRSPSVLCKRIPKAQTSSLASDSGGVSLTDGLLHLPSRTGDPSSPGAEQKVVSGKKQRQTAADFF